MNCKEMYKDIKDICLDVYTDSCKLVRYNVNNMSIQALINIIDKLLEIKKRFKECKNKRKIYSYRCYKDNIDYGHSKQLELLDKAEKICDQDIKSIKNFIKTKETQVKLAKSKLKKLSNY